MNIRKHIELLGHKVEDKVTGFKGTVTSIGFDLYGCVQALVHPGLKKEGTETATQQWFDVSRIIVKSKNPVMPPPNYEYGPQAEGKQGAAEKPPMNKI